jgi:hypothetical protein
LNNVLGEVLTKSAFWAVSQATIKQNLLDYRTVPNVRGRETFLVEAAPTEIAMPEFGVGEDRKGNSIKLPMDKFIYMVESIISLHAFLKYGCSLLVSSSTGIADFICVLELFLCILVLTTVLTMTMTQISGVYKRCLSWYIFLRIYCISDRPVDFQQRLESGD